MICLNKQTYSEGSAFDHLPERIIQFGEGNFLRGFIDWMVHQMNKKNLFNGRVVAIQPTPHGQIVPKLNAQDGLYTVVLRGFENGEKVDQAEVVASISRGINPYSDWSEVLKIAEKKEIEFVFSNTTEAGLSYMKEDYEAEVSPLSFPGKLTAFLYHRYEVMSGAPEAGLKIFPCELLENNGDLLREFVLRTAENWKLPKDFIYWVKEHNRFCNTLVDRIVTGYPKDGIDEFNDRLGYEDQLLTVGEPYHLFAIEADEETAEAIPFHQAGIHVHWVDVKPFRELKVRILNGAHTMMFAAAFLSGVNTVGEAMDDSILREYVRKGIYEEILPLIPMDTEQRKRFADSVVERFRNPYNRHLLLDLSLNAVFKYRARVLPSLLDAVRIGQMPPIISFSLAALIAFYRGMGIDGNQMIGIRQEEEYHIRDQGETLEFFGKAWSGYKGEDEQLRQIVETVLEEESLWGINLLKIDYMEETVYGHLREIMDQGMKAAIMKLLADH